MNWEYDEFVSYISYLKTLKSSFNICMLDSFGIFEVNAVTY